MLWTGKPPLFLGRAAPGKFNNFILVLFFASMDFAFLQKVLIFNKM